jgi:hypothetical protein
MLSRLEWQPDRFTPPAASGRRGVPRFVWIIAAIAAAVLLFLELAIGVPPDFAFM